jgi:hypothetical protein
MRKERNFCELYSKPFPKLMESSNDGTVVMMESIRVFFKTTVADAIAGTGEVVKTVDPYEEVGELFDDWNIEVFIDVE